MSVDDRPSDQPYARWQVVDDAFGGRFIVLRVDGKDPAGHWVYRVVRDFTRPLETGAYGTTSMDDPARLQRYELNYAVNKHTIRLSAHDVPGSDVVYLVGSGPSLRGNWREILDVSRGVVVGVNQTPAVIPTEHMDYFFCIDSSLDGSHWKHRMRQTVGIFDVAVTTAVHQGDFQEMRWFVPASRSAFYDRVHADFPDLVRLEHGLNVTFTALSWIVRVLRAKTIVLVGMDCACSHGMKHFDEPLVFDPKEEYLVARDVRGGAVITNRNYLDMAEWHTAAFYFLKEAGVRVINATEGGILTNFVEQRRLKDVVPEVNSRQVAESLSRQVAQERRQEDGGVNRASQFHSATQ
jgi:hypothetical protein